MGGCGEGFGSSLNLYPCRVMFLCERDRQRLVTIPYYCIIFSRGLNIKGANIF